MVLLMLSACATTSGSLLDVMPVQRDTPTPGYFTVIFSGRHYHEELNAIVIMDLDGDHYLLEPKARRVDYEILTGLSLREAVMESEPFFVLHAEYSGRKLLNSIISPEGMIIGYELRPLYNKDYIGVEDVLISEYVLQKGGKVIFTAREKNIAEVYLETHEKEKKKKKQRNKKAR